MPRSTHTLTDVERALIATEKYQARFWAKVEKRAGDGCWLWRGANSGNGYGGVRVGYRMVPAHRVSWEMVNGPIPDGEWGLHKCEDRYPLSSTEYRLCVRPDHLHCGTNVDNHLDARRAGRAPVGERSGSAKLTPDDVMDIRQHCRPHARDGVSSVIALARLYGVSRDAVRRVIQRKSWSHVS